MVGSDWYNGIVEKITSLKDITDKKYHRWYKFDSLSSSARLDSLAAAAGRVDQFSPDCPQCTAFRDDINVLVGRTHDVNSNKELLRQFLDDVDKIVNKMTGHFKKEHKLVTEGLYKSFFAGAGVVIGMVITFVVVPYDAIWVIVGAAAGLAVGAILDARIKKEDRILYQQPSRRLSNTSWILLLLIVVAVLGVLIAAFFLRK